MDMKEIKKVSFEQKLRKCEKYDKKNVVYARGRNLKLGLLEQICI